jgi:4-hydroxybenzoate polyprenyltransferase
MAATAGRHGWRGYLLHLRPAEWPIMAAHTTLGWLLAEGAAWPPWYAWIGIAVWVVLLNGGTLALNSAFDHDTGDIAFLRNPPPPPRYLASFAVALMLVGGVLTRNYPVTYRRLYLVCAVLSIAYSVPPIRLKAIGGVDWLINMVGFGTLTAYAGWAMSGRPLQGAMLVVVCAFTPLFAALYPLTQLYQMDEDRARGDRTLALRLGPRRSLMAAVFAVGLAFGMFAMAAWRTGWTAADALRWGALGIAALAWLIVLLPWFTNASRWSSREHQAAMYHALAAWALTDVAVFVAWAT